MGGARAWNEARAAVVNAEVTANSNAVRVKTIGAGSEGPALGTDEPVKWISAQIAQKSSAMPSGLPGATGARSDEAATAWFAIEAGASRSACTCPNDTTSWSASAASANHDVTLARDRNQRMAVTLDALHYSTAKLPPAKANDNVTLLQSVLLRIHAAVAENHHGRHGGDVGWLRRSGASQKIRCRILTPPQLAVLIARRRALGRFNSCRIL
jgi:hypothetical protein